MTSSELDNRNIALSMRKSVENLVISSQDAIGQSISQALTFSNVISHHTNQILQENRSVSRSPSPSLRITDTSAGGGAAELFDNDKSCESLGGAGAGAGDDVSVSSAELLGVTLRSDIPKEIQAPKESSLNSTGQNQTLIGRQSQQQQFQTQISTKSNDGSAAGGARVKKKSWYNSLYPTYKSKSDDFKRLFKDLPDDERLIVDYSCALQKDILAHGRLYASQNYMCFYANIFGWETNMTLRWKDVTHITKEKTALVIPNAILVCTDNEKHFLTSFSGRDKAYLMLFRVWQNALMDQPMSSQEIWQWVHSCYGEELGFNSDDEEYSKDIVELDISLQPIDISEELVEAVSCAEAGGEPRDEPRTPRSSSQPRDSSPPLVQSNGNGGYGEEAADTLPTDMSDTSDSEPDNKHNGGECEKCTNPHDGKLILQAQFAFNIDQMFTMIFTNSKFNLELLAARGSSDYVQSPWQAQNGLKCRQISYTLGLTSGPIGPKEVQITETQVMNNCSKAGALYSIDCTSDNAGIPYADYFSVCAHYCLQRVTHSSTMLSFFGAVKYKKNMWPMVKTFLEKNSIGGLEDFARLLESRLHAEAETAVPAARKSRRHRRLTASSVEASASPAPRPPPVFPSPRAAPPRATPSSTRWLLAIVVVLLTINALLYWRLTQQHPPTQDFNDLQNRLSSIQSVQTAEWSRLLERHSARQRDQMARWREALHTTVQHLAQTEQTLTKLLETIKPSLESAQRDADAHGADL